MIRSEYLADALARTVREADIARVDAELACHVGQERLAALAAYGLRGETWYPVPYLLRARPALLGYYRFLYGFSQKAFYSKGPFGRFRTLEESNRVPPALEEQIEALCGSLTETGWELFRGVQPVSREGIQDLQLLTIGPQLRGSENNAIGQGATRTVFDLIARLVAGHVDSSTDQTIVLRNAAGRLVKIAFTSDPDIAVIESLTTGALTTVSIEIKGGGDVSNIHNRLGEAEKSHQKAKSAGCFKFWTILKARVDETLAKRESPTTTDFFSLDDILD